MANTYRVEKYYSKRINGDYANNINQEERKQMNGGFMRVKKILIPIFTIAMKSIIIKKAIRGADTYLTQTLYAYRERKEKLLCPDDTNYYRKGED